VKLEQNNLIPCTAPRILKDPSNSKRLIHGKLSTYFTTVLISRVSLVLSNTMLKINKNILTVIQAGIYEGK
jgi:hypothetical protein